MDRFMFAHNPLREEDSRTLYILHTRSPRIIISVIPLGGNIGSYEEQPSRLARVFESNILNNDFDRALFKVEMLFEADCNPKEMVLTPKLETVLNRAWHWFIAFKKEIGKQSNVYGMPNWVFV